MKRLWFIPILVVFLVVLSVWSMRAADSAAEDMQRITREVVQAAEEKTQKELLEQCLALDSVWQEHYKTLRFFISRNDLNEVSRATSEMIIAARHEEWDECIRNANRCRILADQIQTSESFHVGVFL